MIKMETRKTTTKYHRFGQRGVVALSEPDNRSKYPNPG